MPAFQLGDAPVMFREDPQQDSLKNRRSLGKSFFETQRSPMSLRDLGETSCSPLRFKNYGHATHPQSNRPTDFVDASTHAG